MVTDRRDDVYMTTDTTTRKAEDAKAAKAAADRRWNLREDLASNDAERAFDAWSELRGD